MKETILDKFLRKYRIRMVKPTIEKYNNCRLLDVGCGWEAKLLKSIENYIDYGVGIDFKPPKLKTKKLETIKSVLEKELPFENESFDVVTMLAVLEHLSCPEDILKEIHIVEKHKYFQLGCNNFAILKKNIN